MNNDEFIKQLYLLGFTYRELTYLMDACSSKLGKILKGLRTPTEARNFSLSEGKYKLSEEGRKSLSENGKKSVFRAKKFWTKPEQDFKKLLNEIGLGVKFPEFIKNDLLLEDDFNAKIAFQYPIQRYVCDFVYLDKNIVFRVNGDYWHANPLLYDHEKLTKPQTTNVRQDKLSRIFLEKNGWQVIDIWESELKWNFDKLKEKISSLSIIGNASVLHTDDCKFKSCRDDLDWSIRVKSLWHKKPRAKKVEKICPICEKSFIYSHCRQNHCSVFCARKTTAKIKNKPSKEELAKMIWEMPMTKIAEKYGCSDRAVDKWCKNYEIKKPPMGYWAKMKAKNS